jgi:hypothetical protein
MCDRRPIVIEGQTMKGMRSGLCAAHRSHVTGEPAERMHKGTEAHAGAASGAQDLLRTSGGRLHGGLGLGLGVARGFTEALRGKLTIEDTPGGCATFALTLPTAP